MYYTILNGKKLIVNLYIGRCEWENERKSNKKCALIANRFVPDCYSKYYSMQIIVDVLTFTHKKNVV